MAATSYTLFKLNIYTGSLSPRGFDFLNYILPISTSASARIGANSQHRISGQAPVVCDKKVHRSYGGASQLNCIRRSESPVLGTELCKRICRRLVECDHLQLRKACQIAISQVFDGFAAGDEPIARR